MQKTWPEHTVENLLNIWWNLTEEEIIAYILCIHPTKISKLTPSPWPDTLPGDPIELYLRALVHTNYNLRYNNLANPMGKIYIMVETHAMCDFGGVTLDTGHYTLCAEVCPKSFIHMMLMWRIRDGALNRTCVDLNAGSLKGKIKVTFPDLNERLAKYSFPEQYSIYPADEPMYEITTEYDKNMAPDTGLLPVGMAAGPIHFHRARDRTIVDSGYFAVVCAITITLRRCGVPKDLRKVIVRLYLEKESRENTHVTE